MGYANRICENKNDSQWQWPVYYDFTGLPVCGVVWDPRQ